MSSHHSYERLSIEAFGAALLATEDLDPVYVMLRNAALPEDQLAKWLLAYWCFYHCGVASKFAEMNDRGFWRNMHVAAVNKPNIYPRAAERRHFRACNAINGVSGLEREFLHSDTLIPWLRTFKSFERLSQKVQDWPQFGPWIAFKVCDMAQAVVGVELDLTGADLAIYSEPAKAARIWWEAQPGSAGATLTKQACINVAITHLRTAAPHHLGCSLAPPHYRRQLNIFEFETILCKWKSHLNGHYPIGHDTEEIAKGLVGWGDLAERMIICLGKEA